MCVCSVQAAQKFGGQLPPCLAAFAAASGRLACFGFGWRGCWLNTLASNVFYDS